MRVAVAGTTGFLGSALLQHLLADRVSVMLLTRQEFRDAKTLSEALDGTDGIYFLAGCSNPTAAEQCPHLAEQDVTLVEQLIRARKSLRVPPPVILASSGGTVYDPRSAPPYKESSPTRPRGVYGASRLRMEKLLASAVVPGDTCLRIANAYGPGQQPGRGQGVVATWVAQLLAGQVVTVTAPWGTVRDLVYVDDVVAALLASLRRRSGRDPGALLTVNVGSGTPTTLAELAKLLSSLTGMHLPVVEAPGLPALVPANWLDVTAARSALGWSPQVPLRDGLAWTVRAAKAASCTAELRDLSGQ